MFLQHGYEAASMDMIAVAAGVSKQTIYNHFQNKEALFRDIVADLVSTLMAPLAVHHAREAGPERLLRKLGHDLLSLMLRPTSLALHRLIVAESARFPDFGRAVYAVGPGRVIAMLASYLAEETRDGRLAVADPTLAAEQFLGMLGGRLQIRALLGVGEEPDGPALQQRVDYAVTCFLALYGTGEWAAPHRTN